MEQKMIEILRTLYEANKESGGSQFHYEARLWSLAYISSKAGISEEKAIELLKANPFVKMVRKGDMGIKLTPEGGSYCLKEFD